MFKKVFNLTIIMTFVLSSSVSYALPSNNKNFYSTLKKNKNLTFVKGDIGIHEKFYKKLPNNMFLNLFSGSWLNDKNPYETISVLNNCKEEVDIDYVYDPEVSCIEDIKINFSGNSDKNLLKYVSLIYNDKNIINDIKNSKLLKKGYRFFYYESNEGRVGKKIKLNNPMEQKIYRGKLYDYVLLPYQLTILDKNRDYIKQVEKNWDIDKTLITK